MELFSNLSFCDNCSYVMDSSSTTFYDNTSSDSNFPLNGPDEDYAQFRDSSRFWVKRIFIPLIMCIGVIGNGLTVVILTRRRMRSSTNHYLTALAFSDMFYLIFAFTLALDHYQALGTYIYYSYWRYALMLTDGCSNTSVWLTVTFTIERYVAVCHPIRGKVFCTRSRAKKVIVAVVCLCFLVVIPTPLEWRVVEEVDSENSSVTNVSLEPSELGTNKTYKRIYYWFTSISFIFVPLTLLAIFNTFLIRSVHQSKTQRRRMTMRGHRNDHAHQENRITVMLIAVVIMFLLCQLPTAVILVYTSIYTLHPKSNDFAIVLGLGNICNLLVAINAACNFLLYCAFSDRYRRTFLRIFLPCLFRLASPTPSQTTLNTNCTQGESDSVHGSSFRRGRPSVMSSRRASPGSVQIGLTEKVNGRCGSGGGGYSPVQNQQQRNGHTKKSGKHCYLQVPTYNGVYIREERKDSDATNDTSLSTEELSVSNTTIINGAAGSKGSPSLSDRNIST